MSAPNHTGSDGDNRSNNNNTEKTVAKTAGFVVFSGIAMSILKALNPYSQSNNSNSNSNSNDDSFKSSVESVSPPLQIHESKSLLLKEPTKKSVIAFDEPSSFSPSNRTIEIVKGDTLWGLSRQYGVSIDALKEANGLTGDTIYAGKKLVIP